MPVPPPLTPEQRAEMLAFMKEQSLLYQPKPEPEPEPPRVVNVYFDPSLQPVATNDGLLWRIFSCLLSFMRLYSKPKILFDGLTTRAKVATMDNPPFSTEDIINATKPSQSELWFRQFIFPLDARTIVKAKPDPSKPPSPTEAFNILLIKTMTTIPVPKVHEVVIYGGRTFTVMDRIEGETLSSCWPRLSWWARLRIVLTLRDYLAQLRRLQCRDVPGPFDSTACRGAMFSDGGVGPFESYDALTAWFNRRLAVAQGKGAAPTNAPLFNNSLPLVFTHHDFAMSNILLGRDGRVYIIDWEMSGFYPIWFEHATMSLMVNNSFPSWIIYFITGGWRGMKTHLVNVRRAIVMWDLEE